MADLIEFYGRGCPHCKIMKPRVERLRREERIKIDQKEIWFNPLNALAKKKYDKGYCGGVPFFFNKKTKKWICGSCSYAALKKWAKGK